MDEFIVNEDNIYCYKTPQESAYLAQLRMMPETKTVTKTTPTKSTVQKTASTPVKTTTQTQTPTQTVSAGTNTQTKPLITTTSSNYNKIVYHTVQKGDSLWSIASKYSGVSVDDIRKLNNMTAKTTIHPGMKLKIGLKG